MSRHQVVGTEVDHQAEARDPLIDRTQACAANRVKRREGLVEIVAGQQDAPVGKPHRHVFARLPRRVQQLEANAGDGQSSSFFAEGSRRSEVRGRSRVSPELHSRARVDEQGVRQRGAELIAAVAAVAADVRHAIDKEPVRENLGMIVCRRTRQRRRCGRDAHACR